MGLGVGPAAGGVGGRVELLDGALEGLIETVGGGVGLGVGTLVGGFVSRDFSTAYQIRYPSKPAAIKFRITNITIETGEKFHFPGSPF